MFWLKISDNAICREVFIWKISALAKAYKGVAGMCIILQNIDKIEWRSHTHSTFRLNSALPLEVDSVGAVEHVVPNTRVRQDVSQQKYKSHCSD